MASQMSLAGRDARGASAALASTSRAVSSTTLSVQGRWPRCRAVRSSRSVCRKHLAMAKDRESTRPDFSDRHFSTSGIVTGNMASSYADPAKQHPVTMHPEMREHLEGSVNGKELHSNGVEREDHEDDSDCADPQDCAELLQPFSDSQVGMRKWEATMNCVDRPSKSVNASGIIEVRDVAPRPPNNPSIQIHRPSEGWIAQAHHKSESDLWATICSEARAESEAEPALASFLYASILSHKSIERSMAFILANKVGSPTLLSVHLLKLFNEVYEADPSLVECLRADMEAVRDRDPATSSYTQIMLFFKGYQAVQAYRIAHWLWRNGRRALAVAIQHRVSEIFHVDIHPAARIGRGILVDHATGVVIGETSVVGDNVSILHGVTLGGSGTGSGIRHPRIGHGVLLGAGVCVLGPVTVGDGAKVGAGSVVVTDVPNHSVAVGVPARIVRGSVPSQEPSNDMDQMGGYIYDFII